jgi:hypothetical protein
MNSKAYFAPLALALALAYPTAVLAADGKVTISAPAKGATLDAMDEINLVYEVEPGPKGDHVHVYVDDKEVGILRKLKGSYPLESLSSGQRNICVKVVNKAHVPTGVENCVQVTMK